MRWTLCLLLVVALPVSAAPAWHQGVGALEDKCTVWAARPLLLVTASHCVFAPGYHYDAYYMRGVARVKTDAVVVWDGAWSEPYADLALLVPDKPWPTALSLARTLPAAGSTAYSVTMTFGIRHWPATLTILGLFEVEGQGWVLLSRGEIGPGASGAPLWTPSGIVGMHVASSRTPPIVLVGVPVGTIARAIRAYDRQGPMKPPWE